MSKEDTNLSTSLQKLEIEGGALPKNKQTFSELQNPFMRRKRSKSLSSVNLFGAGCSCSCKQPPGIKHTVSFKRSTNKKVLRDPILKLGKKCSKCGETSLLKLFGNSSGDQDFKSIVDACEQLSLANANDGVQDYSLPSFQRLRLSEKTDGSGSKSECNPSVSTCSHQARMSAPPPCDVTIDELASYFETFVHIPKKMSSMAEMMYI